MSRASAHTWRAHVHVPVDVACTPPLARSGPVVVFPTLAEPLLWCCAHLSLLSFHVACVVRPGASPFKAQATKLRDPSLNQAAPRVSCPPCLAPQSLGYTHLYILVQNYWIIFYLAAHCGWRHGGVTTPWASHLTPLLGWRRTRSKSPSWCPALVSSLPPSFPLSLSLSLSRWLTKGGGGGCVCCMPYAVC